MFHTQAFFDFWSAFFAILFLFNDFKDPQTNGITRIGPRWPAEQQAAFAFAQIFIVASFLWNTCIAYHIFYVLAAEADVRDTSTPSGSTLEDVSSSGPHQYSVPDQRVSDTTRGDGNSILAGKDFSRQSSHKLLSGYQKFKKVFSVSLSFSSYKSGNMFKRVRIIPNSPEVCMKLLHACLFYV